MKFHRIGFESTIHRAENIQFFTHPIKSATMATYVCRPHVIKTIRGLYVHIWKFWRKYKGLDKKCLRLAQIISFGLASLRINHPLNFLRPSKTILKAFWVSHSITKAKRCPWETPKLHFGAQTTKNPLTNSSRTKGKSGSNFLLPIPGG